MDVKDLMTMEVESEDKIFQELTTCQGESVDFMCDFDDFYDLSIVVYSDVINNIKDRWITSDFDEL
jgi:hypothetical protein